MVTDLREGGKKPLAAVARQIRDRLSAQNADRAAKARADEAKTALQSAADFMGEARKLGLAAIDTKVARAEGETGLPRPESVDETAFSLAIGAVGGPVKTPPGYIVLKVVEHLPAAVPPFTEIREQVVTAVKRKKAEAVALERAKQVAAEAKAGDLVAAGKKAGATTGDTPPFSRSKPAERLPGDAMLAALQTVTGAVTGPIRVPQGVYVLKVLERAPADLDELARDREKITREVLAKKQGQAWESWVASARAGARIEMSKVGARRG
jgi:PPIC-type PPIASE domain